MYVDGQYIIPWKNATPELDREVDVSRIIRSFAEKATPARRYLSTISEGDLREGLLQRAKTYAHEHDPFGTAVLLQSLELLGSSSVGLADIMRTAVAGYIEDVALYGSREDIPTSYLESSLRILDGAIAARQTGSSPIPGAI